MKKILCVIAFVLMLSVSVFAEEQNAQNEQSEPIEIGFLTRLKTTEEEFFRMILNSWSTRGWAILGQEQQSFMTHLY